MLYATTRNHNDVFTVYKVIHTDCAPDGGLYLPFRFPKWEKEQIRALADRSFGQNVADVINALFGASLSGWDVDFALGRSPVVMNSVNQRVVIAEGWHNAKQDYAYAVQVLSDKLRQEGIGQQPGDWVSIAVSVAFVFAIYGELLRAEPERIYTPVDFAVTTGSFAMPIAVWYARAMGLNIGNIVCGCNANGGVWDLLHLGSISTGANAAKTVTPNGDFAVPRDLERLVHGTLGIQETLRYLECCAAGKTYGPAPEDWEKLREGMFAAVISDHRVKNIIHSVYRTNQYIFGPYSALAYGSLMDYRAKTGESRLAVLITQRSPLCDGEFTAGCLGLTVRQLQQKMA